MKKVSLGTMLLVSLLAGCGREKVAVYDIPKEVAQPMPLVDAANPAREVTWKTPEGWQEQPPTEMRQGSFLVNGKDGAKADVSVVGFPGDAGGDLANVNRWRGQIHLQPLDESGLQTAVQKIDMNDGAALLVDMDEKSDGTGHKMLAAILHREDKTWFFKMIGDSSVVTAQKNAFLDFLKSVRFNGGSSPLSTMAGAFAAPQPGMQQEQGTSPAKPKWQAPAGWQEQPAGGMRQGSFNIVDRGQKADVSVVALTGDAGGVLANINRWRGQLSLAGVDENQLSTISTKVETSSGAAAVVVDMASEGPLPDTKLRTRILGAIIERGGTTWFVKVTGEESLVERHKAEFLEFVKSFQFPDHA